MWMNRYPDISMPTNVTHKINVTFDPLTGKFVGLPESWSSHLNSYNSLSIRNGQDVYKSSSRKNLKDVGLDISPPHNVKHVLHLRLDSKTGELIGTHMAWVNLLNSSTISESHLNEHQGAVLDALCCHDALTKREANAQLHTNIGSPIPVGVTPRKCNKWIEASHRIEHQIEMSPEYHGSGFPSCSPLTMSGSAAGNMRADIDHTEAVYIHEQLAILAKSVGIIISPTVCGTGFRIGPDYVMTAKHVVDQIMKEAPVVLAERMQSSEELRLRNADVFIDFSHERNGQQGDGTHRFCFEPDIVYANDYLDTVILRLKPDAKMYPPPFIQFSPLSEQTSHGYLIGHPRADIKKTDRYKRTMLTPHAANAAKIWSLSQAGKDGFVGIDDPQRVLLHCSFGKGASGAPGFWICPNNGQAYVVLMLVRGYPDWYYDDKHPAATKVGVPSNHLIEQGVPMETIYKDMKDKAYRLWQEIFCLV